MNNWAQNDPAGAGKFLAGLPEGKSRESAVQTYISQLSYQSPEYAAPFVNLITDENQRFNSAQNLAHNYLRNDPEGYRKWLATLTFPEDKIKRLPK
jgi:hypothetical protein